MDEAMGRRTVGGLLVTKAGSILVFREESPRNKATSSCTRLGCSNKLFPNKDQTTPRRAKEAATAQRSPVLRKSNRTSPQGVNACNGATSRNSACTSGATNNRPRRRENAGGDLLARERVNTSRKPLSSGGSSPYPLSLNTSIAGSSGNSESISRSLRRTASRMRRDGDRNGESPRMFRHRRRLQGGLVSSMEDSLDDPNEYWRFDMNGSEEAEDYYVLSDRHRGMRMDIDDMSYEELLALGERIGTVSTGLSDGALSECLNRWRYVPPTSSSHEDADIKCVICQEEYLSDVEVAKMVCKHYYHITCIQEWLRQKNWCPICKSVASTTNSQCS